MCEWICVCVHVHGCVCMSVCVRVHGRVCGVWESLCGEKRSEEESAFCGESVSETLLRVDKAAPAGLVFRGQGKANLFTHLC